MAALIRSLTEKLREQPAGVIDDILPPQVFSPSATYPWIPPTGHRSSACERTASALVKQSCSSTTCTSSGPCAMVRSINEIAT